MDINGYNDNFAMTNGLPLGLAFGMAMNQLIQRLGGLY